MDYHRSISETDRLAIQMVRFNEWEKARHGSNALRLRIDPSEWCNYNYTIVIADGTEYPWEDTLTVPERRRILARPFDEAEGYFYDLIGEIQRDEAYGDC